MEPQEIAITRSESLTATPILQDSGRNDLTPHGADPYKETRVHSSVHQHDINRHRERDRPPSSRRHRERDRSRSPRRHFQRDNSRSRDRTRGPSEIRPQDRIRHPDAERYTRKDSHLTSRHSVSTATLKTRGSGDDTSHEVSSANPKRPLLPSRAQQTYDQEMVIFRKKHSIYLRDLSAYNAARDHMLTSGTYDDYYGEVLDSRGRILEASTTPERPTSPSDVPLRKSRRITSSPKLT
jgi:hypothetical protein